MKLKILIIIIISTLLSCNVRKTIKIGYISNLSGRQSELGIRGRDGVYMAVDEINSTGGIKGVNVELIVKDNQGNKSLCNELTKELVNQGVEVIIGPLASSMATGVIDGTKNSNVIIISPTVSTDQLTGIDDNFFRVIPSSSSQGRILGEIIKLRKEKKVISIIDESNNEFAKGVISGLNEIIDNETTIYFFNGKETIPSLIDSLENIQMDALLFVSTGIDTAQIIQNLSKKITLPSLYASTWTKLTNVDKHGGKTVNGLIVPDNYVSNYDNNRGKEFNTSFYNRYKLKPNLAAVYSYEATKLFFIAKKREPKLFGVLLKNELLNIETFKGVYENYNFDKFGDVNRIQSTFILKDNKYEIFEFK